MRLSLCHKAGGCHADLSQARYDFRVRHQVVHLSGHAERESAAPVFGTGSTYPALSERSDQGNEHQRQERPCVLAVHRGEQTAQNAQIEPIKETCASCRQQADRNSATSSHLCGEGDLNQAMTAMRPTEPCEKKGCESVVKLISANRILCLTSPTSTTSAPTCSMSATTCNYLQQVQVH